MRGISRFLSAVTLVVLLLSPGLLTAQGTRADYERAAGLREEVSGLVRHTVEQARWLPEQNRFWYRTTTDEGTRFMLVDAERRRRTEAFDHERLAAALAEALETEVDPAALPFRSISFTGEAETLIFTAEGWNWRCDLDSYRLQRTGRAERGRSRRPQREEDEERRVVSPDSTREAFVRDHNLWMRVLPDGEAVQLSHDGSAGEFYTDPIWSPDSRHLAAMRVRPGFERIIHYVESSPEDQLQPLHHTRVYTKPGDALDQRRPQLFEVATARHLEPDDSLYRNEYSNGRLRWREDSRAVTFEFNARGHQTCRVIEIDARTGAVRALIEETSPTFVDYSQKRFRHDLDDGREIIWASERDGWNHLYLYDGTTGEVTNRITSGEWVVRGVEHVDEENRQIVFTAGGREPGDPYLVHYYRVGFDGRGLTHLTPGDGQHSVTFSPDRSLFIDTWSRVDTPPVSVLRRVSDGRQVMELERGEIDALLETGWRVPEVFTAVGRDSETDIWGVIWRPTIFDPDRSWPVIEYIYAGPHSAHVPKTFSAWRGVRYLCELGFVVVQIDGMGTSHRSKAFHDVCWQNLGDAGFPDRILWHRAAAERYPWYDIERGVGIYGHSAGGQNSLGGMLFHPDFYTVAVSSCGCHDNRMDKIWWNEAWMGYPIGEHYERSSNVVNAHRLEGKLLLIVGEMDTNVDPASTMQVVDALIRADRDFDLLVVPGAGHSIGGAYGERKRADFFVRHLMGTEPPDWNRR